SHGAPGAVSRPLDPAEARAVVDEALDEPGARQPVDPGILARGPHAALILRGVEPPDPRPGAARFTHRGMPAQGAFQACHGLPCLPARLARIEVRPGEVFERSAQAPRQRL